MLRRIFGQSIAVGLAFVVAACAQPVERVAPEGVELTPLRTISWLEGYVALWFAGVSGIAVSHDVDCYRMVYRTRDAQGREIVASGLLALPRGVEARTLVSFQHGTTTSRDAVPSQLAVGGAAVAIVMAGNGYAVVAPDYIGLGVSREPHPYLVAEDAARAVVDMITAARRIDGVPRERLFLSGFSQGGQASIAALRMLEASGETVLGAAPVAGPYNIRHVSLAAALRGGARQHSLYLAYMTWGYTAHYGRPLESVLTPATAKIVRGLFTSPHEPEEFIAALPANPRKMFDAAFLDAFDNDKPHWLLDAFAENDVSDWAPRAPVRLYYGSADADVVPAEALGAERSMRARGADVRAVNVGPVEHDPSMLAAAPLILTWLAALDAEARKDTRPSAKQ